MKPLLLALSLMISAPSQAAEPPLSWGAWPTWGDQGDGTYRNPVLPSDYSDLDCIRVGSDYYAISSTFQFSPGVVILHSKDLVNWTILGHAVSDLTQIGPELNWDHMNRYGKGIWAGAIRFHAGKFWIYFGTPDEGYFMTSATNPAGPWEPLHPLLQEAGWDDPCPFWDDDGQGYFVGTNFKDSYKTYIFLMTPDGREIRRETGRLINEGNGREANKLYKSNGWYLHFYSEHQGDARYVMMQRARHVMGPYEEKKQLTRPEKSANEPNQGGIVQTEVGDWFFLTHHGTGTWEGRAASLLPVTWTLDWPILGAVGKDGIGGMSWSGRKPVQGASVIVPQSSDDFDDFQAASLAAQWEWNYQPRAEKWSLSERPGFLRLHAFQPLEADNLMRAGNTLTQRSFRTKSNEVVVKLDLSGLTDGARAGLCHFSRAHSALGVAQNGGIRTLEYRNGGQIAVGPTLRGEDLWLKSSWGLDGQSQYFYSLNGTNFTPFGAPYQLSWGNYRGDRIGIYCFNNRGDAGCLDVDWFRYSFSGPGNQ